MESGQDAEGEDESGDEELEITSASKQKAPSIAELKEKEQHLLRRLAAIDSQCMICGWPFRWSGGDRTHLGAMLYKIEQIYVSLTNHSFTCLFGEINRSHVLHKHSQKLINFQLEYIDGYDDPLQIWKNVTSGSGRMGSLEPRWARMNMQIFVENIALQVSHTLDTSFATYKAFVETTDPKRELGKEEIWNWLESRLKCISMENRKNRFKIHLKDWIHTACRGCNVSETQIFAWETVSLAMYGIRKSHTKKIPEAANREASREKFSRSLLHGIVFFVHIELVRRYPFLKKKRCPFILDFITQLFCLNLQAVSACFSDSSALDPPKYKRGGPNLKDSSLRHRFKSYGAFSACAVMHCCMKTIISIVDAPPEQAVDLDEVESIPESIPFSGVVLEMDIDQFWKYVVVECAEFGFSPTGVRTPRKTVYEFYYGTETTSRFRTVNDCLDKNPERMHGLFANTIPAITNKMISPEGLAMYMFALADSGNNGGDSWGVFVKNLNKIPVILGCVRRAMKTNVAVLDGSIVSNNFNCDPKDIDSDESVKILGSMRTCLLSHEEAVKNTNVIIGSTLLTSTSSPGLWCQLMRARTHKNAVEKLLRMPLLFNEMVTPHVRACVLYLIQKLLASPDPLGEAS
jgi:hypothetical protein